MATCIWLVHSLMFDCVRPLKEFQARTSNSTKHLGFSYERKISKGGGSTLLIWDENSMITRSYEGVDNKILRRKAKLTEL
jgi:hypothetical protein